MSEIEDIDYEKFIEAIPDPKVIEELTYEEILSSNIDILKKKIEDWIPHESDPFMLLLEVFSYKELFLRKRINESIKSMFISHAKGEDLDNLVALYGIQRLVGKNPTAKYKFKLSDSLDKDLKIPSDFELVDKELNRAFLNEDVVFLAGYKEVLGEVFLDRHIDKSDISPEIIATPVPFIVKAEKMERFKNGSRVESDENLRKRAILSLYRSSTAGSVESYMYHSMSSDLRIKDIKVHSPSLGVVEVFYYAFKEDMDNQMQENIEKKLNDKKIKPITDHVKIKKAKTLNIDINLDLYFSKEIFEKKNLLNKVKLQIYNKISKDSFFRIEEFLPLSRIFKNSHISVVSEVKIISPSKSIVPKIGEVIQINNININLKEL
jgi:phage-related baseplate assembly protein